MLTLVNGRQSDQLHVADRSFQYGDGLFETIAIFSGHICQKTLHLQRMLYGAGVLGIPEVVIHRIFDELQRAISGQTMVAKLLVSRGESHMGYRYDPLQECDRVMMFRRMPEHLAVWRAQGVALTLCDHPISMNAHLAGIKHNNRLDQVLARAEWSDDLWCDGVMCDNAGNVIECTSANLFWLKDGVLYTPPLDQCGVKGTMRAQVIRWAEHENHPLKKALVPASVLEQADAIFITNAIIGVVPVVQFRHQSYAVADLVTRIQEELCTAISSE